MKDRIKKYMDYKEISAGELANLLEVQRSNISHILNGRNMPGALFIEKLLLNFPDLNARWLLTGFGEMLMDNSVSASKDDTALTDGAIEQDTMPTKSRNKNVLMNKPVEKVLLLFSDGTFADFEKK
jgi:transcriptional regulator with XRE-family HTH domain